ncbi:MAG: hypothetical protein FJ042_06610 [Candidatus Cloacimonetes bacterium]|nr:hypothetical protein [Candidatus Cloacimonadota bacterium]
MKATVKEGIKGFSGKLDGAVYYYHPRLKRTLMRRMPAMPIQEQNIAYGNIARQIKALDLSEGYRDDFRIYLSALRDRDENVTYPSWYSIFIKMMWALQAKYPAQVDLKTITRGQILAQNLPCRNVKKAVEDGLLEPVPGWQYLDRQI